ncbi:MAG: ATP-binding protein [Synergistaceae bacterium]|nr:ATP-binding protein [Synergistaceae bacterium]
MAFRKAERKKAKLRLAITGPAGSGKTYSALLIAFGIGGRIAMIDTESGSGDLYANLGEYDICSLSAPYDVRKYIQTIHDAEQAGYGTIIIDSLSHAWSGEGGLLDLQGKLAATSKAGNSYTAWRQVTPLHNRLIDAILGSSCHIIATMRSKTEYLQTENERGYKEIKKVGMAPVQREGMDYEFGTVFDLSVDHSVTVSKDRTGLFDGKVFTITQDTGKTLLQWLESAPAEAKPA